MIRMKLLPLRIPGGWLVVKNDFFDVSPEVLNGELSPAGVFVQDILSIERRRVDTPSSPEDDFVFDLGWYPDEDPGGRYRLVLLRENWDNVLNSVESPDRFVIQDTLERWLEMCSNATNLESLLNRLKQG